MMGKRLVFPFLALVVLEHEQICNIRDHGEARMSKTRRYSTHIIYTIHSLLNLPPIAANEPGVMSTSMPDDLAIPLSSQYPAKGWFQEGFAFCRK
jgi:hypothetical protein